jgi:CRP-like cAMP-binding protein
MIEGLDRIVAAHPFFAGLGPEAVGLFAGCARNVRFADGEYLFRTGSAADEFYLVREGRVALEIQAPGRGALGFQTVEAGEIAGLSWLIPPYRWVSDARAVGPVRAIGIDGKCIRGKCEADHELGYQLLMRVVPVLVSRLQATRLQILDVYGTPG